MIGCVQKPNTTFSDTTKPNQFQSPNNNSNTSDDNMPQKNNNMSSLSSTSANKSSMIHESPKDHSINIENAAPYYQGNYSLILVFMSSNVPTACLFLKWKSRQAPYGEK